MPNLLPQIQNNFATLGSKIGGAFGGVRDQINNGLNSVLASTVHADNSSIPQTYNVRGQSINDKDLSILRPTLFSELSNRTPDKQLLEAQTITNTGFNRIPQYAEHGKNFSLSDVLTQPNQYQGYNSKEYNRLLTGSTTPADNQKLQVIDQFINGLKKGDLEDNTDGMVFYSNDKQGRIHLRPGRLYK